MGFFIDVDEDPFNSQFICAFIMTKYWILSNAFSTSFVLYSVGVLYSIS